MQVSVRMRRDGGDQPWDYLRVLIWIFFICNTFMDRWIL